MMIMKWENVYFTEMRDAEDCKKCMEVAGIQTSDITITYHGNEKVYVTNWFAKDKALYKTAIEIVFFKMG